MIIKVSRRQDTKTVSQKGYPIIAVISGNTHFYSGGHYYMYEIAVALSELGAEVHFITNVRPRHFEKDFKDYDLSKIHWHVDRNYKADLPPLDAVIGSPIHTALIAVDLAGLHSCPSIIVVYETPNWYAEYEEDEHKYMPRKPPFEMFKQALIECDRIIAISHEGAKYIPQWDSRIPPDKISVIRPAINHKCANRYKNKSARERSVTYIGRLVFNKQFWELYDVIMNDPEPYVFHVVTSTISEAERRAHMGNEKHPVQWHLKVGDDKKFEILSKTSALILPTKFEGYGMPPQESLYLNTHTIVMDLPVFHNGHAIKDDAHFVKDMKEIPSVVHKVLGKTCTPKGHIPTMEDMKRELLQVKEIPFKWRSEDDILISFSCCVFNNAKHIRECIEAIYDHAYEIIIVEGATDWWANYFNSPTGISTDGTHEIIMDLVKNDSKGVIKYYGPLRFPHKVQMRRYAVNKIDKEAVRSGRLVYWIVDADEIYTDESIKAMKRAILTHQRGIVFQPTYRHHWIDPRYVIEGGPWSAPHTRVVVWNRKYGYHKRDQYYVQRHNEPLDEQGIGLNIMRPKYYVSRGLGVLVPDCIVDHYAYDYNLEAKMQFYKERGDNAYKLMVAVMQWKPGKPLPKGITIKRIN